MEKINNYSLKTINVLIRKLESFLTENKKGGYSKYPILKNISQLSEPFKYAFTIDSYEKMMISNLVFHLGNFIVINDQDLKFIQEKLQQENCLFETKEEKEKFLKILKKIVSDSKTFYDFLSKDYFG